MKIAIVSPGPFSVPPVIGSSVEHDIQMVAEQLEKEHEVTVYTRKCPQYRRSTKKGNLQYKRFFYSHSSRYLKKVIRHLKKQKPDVVMVENRPTYVLQIKKKFPNLPVVLNMHSTLFATPPQISRVAMKQVAKKVDALITNSEYLKKWYIRQFSGFKEKAYAVHLGINPDPYEQAQEKEEKLDKLKKKLQIKEGDQMILFVGRLMKEKGIHLILDILPKIVKENPQVKLVITGASRYGRNLMTSYVRGIYRKAARLGKHVVFTKFIPPDQIPYVYQLADIVVIPSLWHEPFGRVNLEAMASNKAIIASNRGGIPELIRHQESGLIVPLENYRKDLYEALTELLGSQELRQQYGEMGLKRVKDFTWSKTAKGYLKIYESIMKETVEDQSEESTNTQDCEEDHEETIEETL